MAPRGRMRATQALGPSTLGWGGLLRPLLVALAATVMISLPELAHGLPIHPTPGPPNATTANVGNGSSTTEPPTTNTTNTTNTTAATVGSPAAVPTPLGGPAQLDWVTLPIGQGEANVLVCPGATGTSAAPSAAPLVLVDFGHHTAHGDADVGLPEIQAWLKARGQTLANVRTIFLSHLHVDHINLLEDWVKAAPAGVPAFPTAPVNLYVGDSQGIFATKLPSVATKASITVTTVPTCSMKKPTGLAGWVKCPGPYDVCPGATGAKKVTATVLMASAGLLTTIAVNKFNVDSLVVGFQRGVVTGTVTTNNKIIIPGDFEMATAIQQFAKDPDIKKYLGVTPPGSPIRLACQMAHHGASDKANTQAWFKAMPCSLWTISSASARMGTPGYDNGYNHPRCQALTNLQAAHGKNSALVNPGALKAVTDTPTSAPPKAPQCAISKQAAAELSNGVMASTTITAKSGLFQTLQQYKSPSGTNKGKLISRRFFITISEKTTGFYAARYGQMGQVGATNNDSATNDDSAPCCPLQAGTTENTDGSNKVVYLQLDPEELRIDANTLGGEPAPAWITSEVDGYAPIAVTGEHKETATTSQDPGAGTFANIPPRYFEVNRIEVEATRPQGWADVNPGTSFKDTPLKMTLTSQDASTVGTCTSVFADGKRTASCEVEYTHSSSAFSTKIALGGADHAAFNALRAAANANATNTSTTSTSTASTTSGSTSSAAPSTSSSPSTSTSSPSPSSSTATGTSNTSTPDTTTSTSSTATSTSTTSTSSSTSTPSTSSTSTHSASSSPGTPTPGTYTPDTMSTTGTAGQGTASGYVAILLPMLDSVDPAASSSVQLKTDKITSVLNVTVTGSDAWSKGEPMKLFSVALQKSGAAVKTTVGPFHLEVTDAHLDGFLNPPGSTEAIRFGGGCTLGVGFPFFGAAVKVTASVSVPMTSQAPLVVTLEIETPPSTGFGLHGGFQYFGRYHPQNMGFLSLEVPHLGGFSYDSSKVKLPFPLDAKGIPLLLPDFISGFDFTGDSFKFEGTAGSGAASADSKPLMNKATYCYPRLINDMLPPPPPPPGAAPTRRPTTLTSTELLHPLRYNYNVNDAAAPCGGDPPVLPSVKLPPFDTSKIGGDKCLRALFNAMDGDKATFKDGGHTGDPEVKAGVPLRFVLPSGLLPDAKLHLDGVLPDSAPLELQDLAIDLRKTFDGTHAVVYEGALAGTVVIGDVSVTLFVAATTAKPSTTVGTDCHLQTGHGQAPLALQESGADPNQFVRLFYLSVAYNSKEMRVVGSIAGFFGGCSLLAGELDVQLLMGKADTSLNKFKVDALFNFCEASSENPRWSLKSSVAASNVNLFGSELTMASASLEVKGYKAAAPQEGTTWKVDVAGDATDFLGFDHISAALSGTINEHGPVVGDIAVTFDTTLHNDPQIRAKGDFTYKRDGTASGSADLAVAADWGKVAVHAAFVKHAALASEHAYRWQFSGSIAADVHIGILHLQAAGDLVLQAVPRHKTATKADQKAPLYDTLGKLTIPTIEFDGIKYFRGSATVTWNGTHEATAEVKLDYQEQNKMELSGEVALHLDKDVSKAYAQGTITNSKLYFENGASVLTFDGTVTWCAAAQHCGDGRSPASLGPSPPGASTSTTTTPAAATATTTGSTTTTTGSTTTTTGSTTGPTSTTTGSTTTGPTNSSSATATVPSVNPVRPSGIADLQRLAEPTGDHVLIVEATMTATPPWTLFGFELSKAKLSLQCASSSCTAAIKATTHFEGAEVDASVAFSTQNGLESFHLHLHETNKFVTLDAALAVVTDSGGTTEYRGDGTVAMSLPFSGSNPIDHGPAKETLKGDVDLVYTRAQDGTTTFAFTGKLTYDSRTFDVSFARSSTNPKCWNGKVDFEVGGVKTTIEVDCGQVSVSEEIKFTDEIAGVTVAVDATFKAGSSSHTPVGGCSHTFEGHGTATLSGLPFGIGKLGFSAAADGCNTGSGQFFRAALALDADKQSSGFVIPFGHTNLKVSNLGALVSNSHAKGLEAAITGTLGDRLDVLVAFTHASAEPNVVLVLTEEVEIAELVGVLAPGTSIAAKGTPAAALGKVSQAIAVLTDDTLQVVLQMECFGIKFFGQLFIGGNPAEVALYLDFKVSAEQFEHLPSDAKVLQLIKLLDPDFEAALQLYQLRQGIGSQAALGGGVSLGNLLLACCDAVGDYCAAPNNTDPACQLPEVGLAIALCNDTSLNATESNNGTLAGGQLEFKLGFTNHQVKRGPSDSPGLKDITTFLNTFLGIEGVPSGITKVLTDTTAALHTLSTISKLPSINGDGSLPFGPGIAAAFTIDQSNPKYANSDAAKHSNKVQATNGALPTAPAFEIIAEFEWEKEEMELAIVLQHADPAKMDPCKRVELISMMLVFKLAPEGLEIVFATKVSYTTQHSDQTFFFDGAAEIIVDGGDVSAEFALSAYSPTPWVNPLGISKHVAIIFPVAFSIGFSSDTGIGQPTELGFSGGVSILNEKAYVVFYFSAIPEPDAAMVATPTPPWSWNNSSSTTDAGAWNTTPTTSGAAWDATPTTTTSTGHWNTTTTTTSSGTVWNPAVATTELATTSTTTAAPGKCKKPQGQASNSTLGEDGEPEVAICIDVEDFNFHTLLTAAACKDGTDCLGPLADVLSSISLKTGVMKFNTGPAYAPANVKGACSHIAEGFLVDLVDLDFFKLVTIPEICLDVTIHDDKPRIVANIQLPELKMGPLEFTKASSPVCKHINIPLPKDSPCAKSPSLRSLLNASVPPNATADATGPFLLANIGPDVMDFAFSAEIKVGGLFKEQGCLQVVGKKIIAEFEVGLFGAGLEFNAMLEADLALKPTKLDFSLSADLKSSLGKELFDQIKKWICDFLVALDKAADAVKAELQKASSDLQRAKAAIARAQSKVDSGFGDLLRKVHDAENKVGGLKTHCEHYDHECKHWHVGDCFKAVGCWVEYGVAKVALDVAQDLIKATEAIVDAALKVAQATLSAAQLLLKGLQEAITIAMKVVDVFANLILDAIKVLLEDLFVLDDLGFLVALEKDTLEVGFHTTGKVLGVHFHIHFDAKLDLKHIVATIIEGLADVVKGLMPTKPHDSSVGGGLASDVNASIGAPLAPPGVSQMGKLSLPSLDLPKRSSSAGSATGVVRGPQIPVPGSDELAQSLCDSIRESVGQTAHRTVNIDLSSLSLRDCKIPKPGLDGDNDGSGDGSGDALGGEGDDDDGPGEEEEEEPTCVHQLLERCFAVGHAELVARHERYEDLLLGGPSGRDAVVESHLQLMNPAFDKLKCSSDSCYDYVHFLATSATTVVLSASNSGAAGELPHLGLVLGNPSCSVKYSIDLSHNLFVGDISSELGSPCVETLNLGHNALTGSLAPLEWASGLQHLDLSFNPLLAPGAGMRACLPDYLANKPGLYSVDITGSDGMAVLAGESVAGCVNAHKDPTTVGLQVVLGYIQAPANLTLYSNLCTACTMPLASPYDCVGRPCADTAVALPAIQQDLATRLEKYLSEIGLPKPISASAIELLAVDPPTGIDFKNQLLVTFALAPVLPLLQARDVVLTPVRGSRYVMMNVTCPPGLIGEACQIPCGTGWERTAAGPLALPDSKSPPTMALREQLYWQRMPTCLRPVASSGCHDAALLQDLDMALQECAIGCSGCTSRATKCLERLKAIAVAADPQGADEAGAWCGRLMNEGQPAEPSLRVPSCVIAVTGGYANQYCPELANYPELMGPTTNTTNGTNATATAGTPAPTTGAATGASNSTTTGGP